MDPKPEKSFCDIVMKGGITSGVVFPLAIVELAKLYQLKNVGGASAGAIAASLAAAAQHGEKHGGTGFERLAKLPQFLGAAGSADWKGSNLFHLFQPQADTKPLFETLIAGLGVTGQKAVGRISLKAVSQFPLGALLGSIPGVVLAVTAWLATGDWPFLLVLLVFAAALVLVGAIAGAGWQFLHRVRAVLPKNRFGLCSGMGGTEPEDPGTLTPWLAGLLDELSGKHKLPGAGPLTFGDLWGPQAERGDENPGGDREVNLEMMTSCLSHGRPYRLPFRQDQDVRENQQFYFSPAEFRKLFPAKVVDWMEQKARPDSQTLDQHAGLGLCALPEPWDLPVVVAVRMSLSFPVLLSAVPLWSVDRTLSDRHTRAPERCWFSDGGICSNFPVHFFDSPLPRWPTFALNLRDPHPERGPVWMPQDNREGAEEWWTRFEAGDGLAQFGGFLGAIFNTMQNWSDNIQLGQPGCRDRVAHLVLAKNEGGLNLNMPPRLIEELSQRGGDAGKLLAARFHGEVPGCPLTWENHRWTRFRATTAALEAMLLRMQHANEAPRAPDAPYTVMMDGYGQSGSPSYPWNTQGQFKFAEQAVKDLLTLVHGWSAQDHRFAEDIPHDRAPRPRPELRVRPRV